MIPINDQALNAGGIIRHNIGCPHFLSAQGLLSEEVSLVEVSDELVLGTTALLHSYLHLKMFTSFN